VKVAITGATGFIGRELVLRHLEAGNSVRILTRKSKSLLNFPEQVEIINGDLSDAGGPLLTLVEGVDVLYHCAAEIIDESKMFDVNVTGTKNLADASNGNIKHWVQLSSTGVYGKRISGIITEKTKPDPDNTYEITKLQSDEIVAGSENKFTYTILRPSNVFGEGMKNQSLFQLIKIIDKGFFAFIGKKGASANYVPVENVISALMLCGTAQNAKGKTYIISDCLTIEQFVAAICKGLNKPFPKIRVPKFLVKIITSIAKYIPDNPLTPSRIEALTNTHVYSDELIAKELEYHQAVSLEDGVLKLVRFYRNGKNL
jgi:nucleoside-diphosphate-sugar epimerase